MFATARRPRSRRRRRKASRAARISAPSRRPNLFASDCTGSGCHKGPQGLARASPGRARGLPARALHQQPRKRRGAGRTICPDSERTGAAQRRARRAAASRRLRHRRPGNANWNPEGISPTSPRPPNEVRAPGIRRQGRRARPHAPTRSRPQHLHRRRSHAAGRARRRARAQRGRPGATAAVPSPRLSRRRPPRHRRRRPAPKQYDIFD